jgi:hypothetical protein
VEKAAKVFVRNELTPLQERIKEVNDSLGGIIRFKNTASTMTTSNPTAPI